MFKLLMIIGVIFFIIPTLFFFIRLWLLKWFKSNKQKTDRALKQHYEKEYEKIYESEYKDWYEYTRLLFSNKMKNKKMNKQQILEFKNLVNKSLGSYINQYKDWKFKNDAMEIYSKLKDIHIDKSDFQMLINYLEKH